MRCETGWATVHSGPGSGRGGAAWRDLRGRPHGRHGIARPWPGRRRRGQRARPALWASP